MTTRQNTHVGRHTQLPIASQRHTTDGIESRAFQVESGTSWPGGGHAHMSAVTAHRHQNPTRSSAGICPSCDGPIDAITGECRCSA